jgi:4-coumarate--CoA ligase
MRVYKSCEIDIPHDLNLTELLHLSAGTQLPASHLIAKDSLTNRSITIGELRDRAGRIANGFHKKLSPSEGDRWAIILPNCVEYIEVTHAVLWTGGVACPINHALKASEIAHAFLVSRPRFVIAYGSIVSKLSEALKTAQGEAANETYTWPMPRVMTAIRRVKGCALVPEDFFDKERLSIPHYQDARKHLASIHLSSGTTGKPKGVELTHHNFVANCYQLYNHDPEQFHPGSRTVAFTPFVHIAMTTMPLFFGPWTGMMHHAMPTFELEAFGELVSSNQATSFQGVPSVAIALAKTDLMQRYDFSKAEFINCGGAPMKKDLVDRLMSRAPWKLIQVYGMTEGAPYIAYQRRSENLPYEVTGRLLPNIEAVLKRENSSEDAPEGGPGELWLRGPNITRGYSFASAANVEAFPREDWYNTGDVCTISHDGYLSVVGRTKELIKYKGFQVSPVELESHLNSHPLVLEAGVASIWDESQLTELPTAYVILRDESGSDTAKQRVLSKIHSDVDDLVTGYKKLRGGVWNIKSLPKNATGKILRKELRSQRLGLSSLDKNDFRAKL